MKAQFEEMVELEGVERGFMKSWGPKKQVSLAKNKLVEKDKIIVEQSRIINQSKEKQQLKYDEGIFPGLELALGFVLEKYLDLDVSSIKEEIEESKAELWGKAGLKRDQNAGGGIEQV